MIAALVKTLGPEYAHVIIMIMGVVALSSQCAAAIHAAWNHGTIDQQGFGIGTAAIITATGAALGMGVKRDA